MISVAQFRAQLKNREVDEIVEDLILTASAAHVSDAQRKDIRVALASAYGVAPNSPSIFITGSAQLGFSISAAKRYKLFDADSDIDAAVICPEVFNQIWQELGDYAHGRITKLPWDSGKLGDYLLHGWLRPDHFPKGARLPKCDAWRDTFSQLSARGDFKHRKVSGALFYSLHHLIAYQRRSVRECVEAEEITK